jgi:flagellar assembly protein FliH
MAQPHAGHDDARALSPEDIMRLVREAGQSGFARSALDADRRGAAFTARDPLGSEAPAWGAERQPHQPGAAEAAAPFAPARAAAPASAAAAATAAAGAPDPAAPGAAHAAAASASQPRPAAPSQPDITALLEQARADAFEQGRTEGFEQGYAAGAEEGRMSGWTAGLDAGRKEAEEDLRDARDTFLQAALVLTRPDASDLGMLTPMLLDAVRTLASERAGMAIAAMPEAFVARIEALAAQAVRGLESLTIRLNPEDYAAIAPHLPQSELLAESRILREPALARGDLVLRAGGVELRDVLGVRPARTGSEAAA